jgi:tetratricopeptide (TPR) repeat protein
MARLSYRYFGIIGGLTVKHGFVLAMSAALAIVAIQPTAAADDAKPTPIQAFRAALDAYKAGDCAKATSLTAPLIKGGPAVPGPVQASAYDIAITCALKDKDLDKAGDYARRATALPDGSDFAWRIRFAGDAETKRYGAAVDTLERMTQGHGSALNAIRPVWLWQLRLEILRAGDEVNETRLLAIMANPAYDPDDMAGRIQDTGDAARAMYAGKLLKAGKRDAARAQLDGLRGFRALSKVALDPELAALRGSTIDLRAAMESDLVRHREMMTKYPRWLGAINAAADDLQRLGRADEAIALLEAVVPRLGTDTFDDRADALPWFWNALAYAYESVGKYDEMVASFVKGAAQPEDGMGNVSQPINLAAAQIDFGRAGDALATLKSMGEKPAASAYGLMQIRIVRGCANAALGRLDAARADLAYAVANPKDDPAAIGALKLCVGDEAGAAASYVVRLADPDTREAALLDLPDYDPPIHARQSLRSMRRSSGCGSAPSWSRRCVPRADRPVSTCSALHSDARHSEQAVVIREPVEREPEH